VPYPGGRVAVACVLACAALVALLAHQVYTRRTGRTVALLALAVPLVLGTAVTWTVDFARPSRAAAFPPKPLALTEGLTFSLEMPARFAGTQWVWDAEARRNVPLRAVSAYADLSGTIPGRYFELAEGNSTLRLRDGRELTFPSRQLYVNWHGLQRESAICRTLGLEFSNLRGDQSTQGSIHLFSLPEKELATLGGTHGRLTTKLVVGETAFREDFRLPARIGATHREPGVRWRIEAFTRPQGTDGPVEVIIRFLRATTMLAPRGDSRADVDLHPNDGRLFFFVNRKRGEYNAAWADRAGAWPGIVASSQVSITLNNLRAGGRKVTDRQIDDAWLADAELVVLRTEPVGKTEKIIVVEDFEVPRLP
jgi:hypothetical protein